MSYNTRDSRDSGDEEDVRNVENSPVLLYFPGPVRSAYAVDIKTLLEIWFYLKKPEVAWTSANVNSG